MADFAFTELQMKTGDVVEVSLDRQANVMLLDSANFARYKAGENFFYNGGWSQISPLSLPVPSSGTWYLIVDLGNTAGVVHFKHRIINK